MAKRKPAPPKQEAKAEPSQALAPYQAEAQAIANQYLQQSELVHREDYHGRLAELADPDVLQRLFTALADGNYPSAAATAAGIHRNTLDRWMKLGEEQPDSAYGAFVAAVKRAEAEAEAALVAKVNRASNLPQFWAAGMTLLERRHPEKWARRQDDSGAGPRVVIQIGVKDSDVQFGTTGGQHNQG